MRSGHPPWPRPRLAPPLPWALPAVVTLPVPWPWLPLDDATVRCAAPVVAAVVVPLAVVMTGAAALPCLAAVTLVLVPLAVVIVLETSWPDLPAATPVPRPAVTTPRVCTVEAEAAPVPAVVRNPLTTGPSLRPCASAILPHPMPL